ncbi:MAG TPA: carboxypeptidase regulatory-like domain-containing protein [Cyclobacteriaceae bacterium]
MNSKRLSLTLVLASFCFSLLAQVSGMVTDSRSGKPVKECEVFINNSSLSTTTNNDGYFELSDINIGFYDLVIYHEKYEIFKSPLQIKPNKAYKLNLTIDPLTEKIKTVRVKQDEEWISNFNWFKQGFLGANTSECTIANDKALSFQREGFQLKAFASEPIIIENKALGYKMKYYLYAFVATEQEADVQGLLKFELQTTLDYAQGNTWARNRQIAFWGSARHLFQSVANGNYMQQGFELTDDKGNELESESLAKPSRIEGYFNIDLPDQTLVKYLINADTPGLQPKASDAQKSAITRFGSIDVSPDGIPLNSASIKIEGDLNKVGLALAIPINYSPETSIEDEKMDWQNFALLQEKVYIQTDRDYYYPRETIWFKAYLGFSIPILRDTLSRLLYVDFIAPSGNVILSKNIKIRNGIGWGEFVLPPMMDEGEYYIRAHTNWMRNYKDSLYIKPVPILGWNQNLVTQNTEVNKSESPFKVAITPEKNSYGTREPITLTIAVQDKSGQSVPGNISIAVVDAEASGKIPQVDHILTPGLLTIDAAKTENKYFDQIEHFMERGVSFTGKVVDNKGNPTPATVNIVQGNMDNLIDMETDVNGEFLVTGLDFYDSLYFAFKSINEKGKMFGTVELLPKERIPFAYSKPKLKLEYRSDDALQRVQNTYDLDKNTILLNEVVITDKAIEEESKLMPKVYGQPDYTVKGTDMRGATAGSNPLIALQGRVPGLRVTEYFDDIGMRHTSVKIRGGSSSMAGNTDPLILVDGIPWGSPDDLMGISPSTIEYVEVITRGVSTFGSRGANGVIAIYTKRSVASSQFSPDFMAHKIGGYTRALTFSHPDYSERNQDSNPDFRTTLYWNPYLTLNSEKPAEVKFYSADVETKYRITVEGMTRDGKPFSGEAYVTIAR